MTKKFMSIFGDTFFSGQAREDLAKALGILHREKDCIKPPTANSSAEKEFLLKSVLTKQAQQR
jgi:hypothetical protein